MKTILAVIGILVLAVVSFGVIENHQELSRQDAARTAVRAEKLDSCLALADDALDGILAAFNGILACNSADANHEFDGLAKRADWNAKVKRMEAKVQADAQRSVKYSECVDSVVRTHPNPADSAADAFGACASKYLF
jgi:hypothetical protein